jgi:hypothetical protein
MSRSMIDSTTGAAFMSKTLREAKAIIKKHATQP